MRTGAFHVVGSLVDILSSTGPDNLVRTCGIHGISRHLALRLISCSGQATGTKNARGGPQTRVVRGKRGKAKNIPLKRFLQKQDTKRRTALYVACAAGEYTMYGIQGLPNGADLWVSIACNFLCTKA